MKEPAENEIWTRWPRETARAYRNFSAYRDLGSDRTLRAAAEKLGLTLTRMRALSARWKWIDRAVAYDDWTLIQEQKFEIHDRNAMKKRHINSALAVQQRVVRRLSALTEAEMNKLPFSQLVYAMDVAQRLEREARGESAENAGGVSKVEFIVHAPTEPIPIDPHKDNSQHHNLPQSVTSLSR